jgi:hypothetical protein
VKLATPAAAPKGAFISGIYGIAKAIP